MCQLKHHLIYSSASKNPFGLQYHSWQYNIIVREVFSGYFLQISKVTKKIRSRLSSQKSAATAQNTSTVYIFACQESVSCALCAVDLSLSLSLSHSQFTLILFGLIHFFVTFSALCNQLIVSFYQSDIPCRNHKPPRRLHNFGNLHRGPKIFSVLNENVVS